MSEFEMSYGYGRSLSRSTGPLPIFLAMPYKVEFQTSPQFSVGT